MYLACDKVNPSFNYEGVLTFNGEEELTITAAWQF